MQVIVIQHDQKFQGTLLDAIERVGIQHEYQCRSGYCGACRSKVVGEVEYFIQPLAWISKDEVLPCCCRAKTGVLIIKP